MRRVLEFWGIVLLALCSLGFGVMRGRGPTTPAVHHESIQAAARQGRIEPALLREMIQHPEGTARYIVYLSPMVDLRGLGDLGGP